MDGKSALMGLMSSVRKCVVDTHRPGSVMTGSVFLLDGAGDCLDGSDEVNCEVSIACPGQKAQCPGHSQCREAWELCDVHGDCGDGLNEARCSPNCCLEGQWQCRNQVYVVDSWRCDGVNDCGDSSDEDACASCPEGTVRCDEGKCILESLMCDGEADRPDGADEPTICGEDPIARCHVGVGRLRLHQPMP
ncbi:LDL receptor repeat-containing protein egg-1-like [Mirounga leonina]|uniref:LDL receptor repeat-containing protein egg-1-like n=1 Tax=Mirounga leonina TaxID=9715 RepID=UPI00156C3E8D|nr:LDL receptor repeat-containing protein egg-1-like [Mirounga leonina]